jgi:hypothetical protein
MTPFLTVNRTPVLPWQTDTRNFEMTSNLCDLLKGRVIRSQRFSPVVVFFMDGAGEIPPRNAACRDFVMVILIFNVFTALSFFISRSALKS